MIDLHAGDNSLAFDDRTPHARVSAAPRMATHRILSWNVNGLRACEAKGFRRWLDRGEATIVGVQEVRALREDLPRRLAAPRGWHTHFETAARRGYSGVGLYARRAPDELATALGSPSLDREGRLQLARFGRLAIANVYFPNGNGKQRDNSRVPFKLRFYRRLFERLEKLRAEGLRVLVLGDYNTTRSDLDLARPKDNRRTSGCLPSERNEFARWIEAGWVDTFRAFEAGGGHYSWWSQRQGVRARNVGWRIDHVLASPEAMPYVRSAFIERDVRGSDHAPVGVTVDDAIFGDPGDVRVNLGTLVETHAFQPASPSRHPIPSYLRPGGLRRAASCWARSAASTWGVSGGSEARRSASFTRSALGACADRSSPAMPCQRRNT